MNVWTSPPLEPSTLAATSSIRTSTTAATGITCFSATARTAGRCPPRPHPPPATAHGTAASARTATVRAGTPNPRSAGSGDSTVSFAKAPGSGRTSAQAFPGRAAPAICARPRGDRTCACSVMHYATRGPPHDACAIKPVSNERGRTPATAATSSTHNHRQETRAMDTTADLDFAALIPATSPAWAAARCSNDREVPA
jgi:hypothetical protein